MGTLFGFLKARKEKSSKIPKGNKNKYGKDILFTLSQSTSFVSEQFRIIRAVLLRSAKDRDVRTILVTSALPQEGKTFVSSNLAVSIAQESSEHVVLIDSDLRNPSLYSVFGIEKEQGGLSRFFSNGLGLPDLLHKTDIPNLSVIPSGPRTDKVEEVFSAKKMRFLINEIKSFYGSCYIIIDSGPVQLLADTLMMAELVDGIVLVVKMGETKRSMVKKTVEVVGKERIIGIVLNYCALSSKVYQRYYKYYNKKGPERKLHFGSRKE